MTCARRPQKKPPALYGQRLAPRYAVPGLFFCLRRGAHSEMVFVATASQKAASCSTKTIVGAYVKISCSICMRE